MNSAPAITHVNSEGKTLALACRHIVIDCTRSGGGVTYERQLTSTDVEGDGITTTSLVVKNVDNEAIVKQMAKLRNKLDYTFRSTVTSVKFGYVATDEQLATLKEALKPLHEEAATLNAKAARVKCKHRVHVGLLAFKLSSGDSADAVEAIAETIVDHMKEYYEALHKLDLDWIKKIQLRSRNLDKLAVGIPGTILKSATACAKDSVKIIREGAKNADSHTAIRGRLNLGPIQVCEAWFSKTSE